MAKLIDIFGRLDAEQYLALGNKEAFIRKVASA